MTAPGTARPGRGAFTVEAWAWTAPLAIVLLPLSEPLALADPHAALGWLAIGAVAWTAFGAVLLVAALAIRRQRLPVSVVVGVGVVAGMARSATIAALAPLVGAPTGSVGLRLLTGAVLGASWALLASFALHGLASYRARRAALLEQYVEARRHRGDALRRMADLRGQLAQDLDEPVSDALRVLSRGSTPAAAEALRRVAVDHVRPASHRLAADSAEPDLPRLSVAEVRVVLVRIDLRVVLLLCALVLVVSGPIIARSYGVPIALLGLGAFSGTIVLATWLAPPGRGVRGSLALWLVGLLVASGVGGLVLALAGMPATAALGWALAAAVSFPLIAAALGLALAAPEIRTLRLDALADIVDRSRLDALAWEREEARTRMEAAEFLHSTVQSRLLAASAALRLAQAQDDPDLRDEAVRSAAQALHGWGEADGAPVETSSLRMVAEQWAGLVEVTVRGDDFLASVGAATRRALVDIVAEAAANAARHGGATHVDVAIGASSGMLTLTVSDDGGFGDGPPGLGTSLLDRRAPGGWCRRRNRAGGTDLIVTLPVGHDGRPNPAPSSYSGQ